MIKLDDLSFSYGKKEIFKNLSHQMSFRGDERVLALLGPNGCGKSTLLKLIAGQLKAKKGQIDIDGQFLDKISYRTRPKLIGMIQQNAKFDFPFTCFDTVLMGRYAHKGEFEDYRQVDLEASMAALNQVGMDHLIDHKITEISGGEFQRVMIARTLAQGPKYILLDEAFSAMDIKHKQEILHLLRSYARDHDLYIVMVVHDINLAYKYSDQVLMMKEGKIIHHGNTRDTIQEASIQDVFDVQMKHIHDEGFLLI